MKNFTLFLFFILVAAFKVDAQSQMNLPVTFDEPDVNYGIVGFGGADDSAIVEDPTDANNKVARITKNAEAELWAGATVTAVTDGLQTGFSSRIPFTGTQTKMSVRVWSPDAGIPVRLKVEDHLDPTKSVETEATTTAANEWETLTFDFANQAAGTEALNLSNNFNKASLFFNFGVTGAEAGEKTYYFDDMVFIAEEDGENGGDGGSSGLVFPITFEEDITWNEVITNFDGGELTVVDNPDTDGNASAKVGRMVKNAGQPWGGSFMVMDQNIDLAAGTEFTVAVWAPRADTKMLFKLENENDGAQAFEQELTIAESNQWVDVTFNMAGANRGFTYKKVVLIFDLGTVGDGSAGFTWYVDNIRQLEGEGNGGGDGGDNSLTLPVSFDEDLDYGLTDFGGNESEIVVDPTNADNKVAKSIKTSGAETWAGTTVGGTAGFASPIPFVSGSTKMSLRVWSPTVGIPVRLKVEASNDPTISVETEATVTVAEQWQTLTFDFANQAAGTEAINFSRSYNKASVFFNFGTTGAAAGEQIYYWDDMTFGSDDDGDGGNGGSSGLVFPITFEEDITWNEVITNFDGGDLTVVDNPDTDGNASAKVGRMVKNDGQPWGGSFIVMDQNIDLSADTEFTVAVWAPRADTKMLFKLENENDGAQAFEQELTIPESNQWVDVTFDMAGANRGFTYKKVVLIFDLGTVGDGSSGFTWYLDNIRQGEGDGNGGGDGNGETGENIIINGDFADGLNSWTPFIADFAGVSATVAATDGEASITNIAGAGGEIWHVQFNQIFTAAQIGALEVGQDYIAKFDARSSVDGRALRLYFGEDGGGFASVSVTDHTLNTEMQTIEVPFNMSNKYGAMKFGFEMGLSNDPVFIRNVSLTKVGDGGNGGGGETNLELPVTFENDDFDYGLTDFGGNASEIVVDPTNAGNKVAKSVKTAEAELWAGTTVGGTAGFASPIPFASGDTKMSLRVWSPAAGIPVRVKVEDANDPTISVETEATVTVAEQWQTLTFDFANQAAGTEAINFARSYNKASVFFNFGTTGGEAGEQTYYWDDMTFGSEDDGDGNGETGENIIINGDFADALNSWTPFIADFAGVSATVAATDGEASITNIAGAGGEIWHVQFNQIFTAAQIGALEVGQDYIAKFDARSSVDGRALRLYFGEDGGGFASVSVTDHTLNTEMQTIEVPFNMSNKYGAMKFGFEMGLSNDPVFIRNVSLTKVGDGGNGGGGETNLELPVTFENDDLDYGLTDFGGNASEIVVDPTNAGNKVAKSVKTAEAELWAGTTVGGTAGFASPIPFASGDTKMSLRVWSPAAGIPVRVKVEDANDPTISVETEATVTVAEQWQTLTFDFANQAAGTEAINFARSYNKASVFFNFGTTGAEAGEQTYYWDDMTFGEIVQEEQVITFPEIEDKTLGDAPFNLNATSTSGLAISYSSDNSNVSISEGVATLVNPGKTTITASQSGNLEFFPATPISQTFCINPAKPVITVSGQGTEAVTLTSSSQSGNQWYLDGEAIPDATGSSIAISSFGTYTVQVTIDECVSEISDEITLIVNSVRTQITPELKAFPNPVENILHVRGLNGPIGYSEMVDMAGRPTSIVFSELDNEYQADVSRLSPGIYLLRMQQGNRNYLLKIIKK
jgi:uncharacterized beta-barrel protein YwiB (DUF1934 family)